MDHSYHLGNDTKAPGFQGTGMYIRYMDNIYTKS